MTRDANGRFASESGGAVQNGTVDPLSEYREGLAALIRAHGKLETLRAMDAELRGSLGQLEDERERCLSSDSDDSVEELSRLNARLEITRRRILNSEVRLREAERELSDCSATILNRFQSLGRSYRAWAIEAEKAKLLELMVSGCEQAPAFDWCVLRLKSVDAVNRLEIAGGTDAGGFGEQCSKLLDAISASSEFPVPAYTPPAVSPGEADIGLPYVDRGMTAQEIEGELRFLRLEHPELDAVGVYRKLREKHPELFEPPANDFEFERQTAWPAGMVGETVVPEPKPSYAR